MPYPSISVEEKADVADDSFDLHITPADHQEHERLSDTSIVPRHASCKPKGEKVLSSNPTLDLTNLHSNNLSTKHDWPLTHLIHISWNKFIINQKSNRNLRPDIMRWLLYGEVDHQSAKDAWSKFVECYSSLFIVPPTVQSARQFARDIYELKYLEEMSDIRNNKQLRKNIKPVDLPILKHNLHYRWWHQFHVSPQLILEMFLVNAVKKIISFDGVNISMVQELIDDLFPQRPSWWLHDSFPSGVICPVPLYVHFYHDIITTEEDCLKQCFDNDMIRWEKLIIFTSCW